jgi:hypothetical protein
MMNYTPKRDCAIFEKDGDLLIPTVLAKGPWYANSLHGSSMMGLMARAAEQHPSDIPRLVSRLTVDMMRAAPMAPLRTETEIVRSGKNVEFLDVRLFAGAELFIRATAMRKTLPSKIILEASHPTQTYLLKTITHFFNGRVPKPLVTITPSICAWMNMKANPFCGSD